MNFETKYLIRWGIPGWVLIFWLFYQILFWKDINPLDSSFVDVSKGLTLLISLAAIGVPIGYILHQIYFGLVWIINKNRNFNVIANKVGDKFPKHSEWGESKNEDYYQLEFVWHSMLLSQDEEARKYLEERYRYLLNTVHGLGALFMSSLASLIGTMVIIFSNFLDAQFGAFFWIGFVFQMAIFLSSLVNYVYFSNNLRAFQIKVLKKYL